jgi:hypothetical protein
MLFQKVHTSYFIDGVTGYLSEPGGPVVPGGVVLYTVSYAVQKHHPWCRNKIRRYDTRPAGQTHLPLIIVNIFMSIVYGNRPEDLE